jgi:hypothetical protein
VLYNTQLSTNSSPQSFSLMGESAIAPFAMVTKGGGKPAPSRGIRDSHPATVIGQWSVVSGKEKQLTTDY